jgi:rod shape determining protein RodA
MLQNSLRKPFIGKIKSRSQPKWLEWLLEIDWILIFLSVGLTAFGTVAIHSTEVNIPDSQTWFQHGLFGLIGLGLAFLISRSHYQNLLQWKWVIYAATNISLLAVMFIGTTALGAQRWITIGGFNVQPSEFAKLGVIITLAALLEEKTAANIPAIVKSMSIVTLPWILVFLQPDLGTSLVFGAVVIGMLYWGNANLGWLVLMVSPIVSSIFFSLSFPAWLVWINLMGAVAWFSLPGRWISTLVATAVNVASGRLGSFLWDLLKDYQKDRVILFLHPERDPLGGGYHLIQSRIAIGSGGLSGRGLFNGTQTQGNFIPEQHTDFIFSAIGEELGFIGAVVVVCLFWLICLRLIIVASCAADNFGSLLCIGIMSMIVFQVVINLSMTIGLAPVTGIPLPWMSYGRSALLTNFMAIGLAGSVWRQRPRKKRSQY